MCRQPLHLCHGSTRAVAWRGIAADAHGGVAIETDRLHGALDPACCCEARQWNSLALGIGHIQPQKIVGLHACHGIGLNHNALQPTLVGEVVDVCRAQGSGDGAVDGIKADTQCTGLVAINVELQLRSILQSIGPYLG